MIQLFFNTEAKFSSITCEDNDILKVLSEWSSYVMIPVLNLYQ